MRRWQRLFTITLSVLTVTGLALLVVRIMDMSDESVLQSVQLIPTVLKQTHFGIVWGLHLATLFALWLSWLLTKQQSGRFSAYLMLLLFAVMAFTYSASSHAADGGDFTLTELNDWLHIIFTAIWGGGIFAATCFVLPSLQQIQAEHITFTHAVRKLSRLFILAVFMVLVTGVVNVAIRVNSFTQLLDHSYGYVLLWKTGLVALMLALGAISRYKLCAVMHNPLSVPDNQNSSVRNLLTLFRVDAVLVSLVLVFAAILIQSMPA